MSWNHQSLSSKGGFLTPCRLILALALGALLVAPVREAPAVELKVLAAGAVEAVVRDMVGSFEKESGHKVQLAYAPVGALRDKIYAGEAADLTVVTPVIIEQLLARGLVRPATRTDLGKSEGVSPFRKGAPRPAIGTSEELKQALWPQKRSTTPIRRSPPPALTSLRWRTAWASARRFAGRDGPPRRQGFDGINGKIDRCGRSA